MKNQFQTLGRLVLGLALTINLITNTSAQTNLNFNRISATVEGAISLSWNSVLNEYYRIECADSLVNTNTGLIAWKLLYDNYPAQGTNTLWLDTGNYLLDPVAEHPTKSPMRFYRIVLVGTNTAPAPSISIVSPTNGFTASDRIEVIVSAASEQPFISTKLYVDGEEMQDASSITNYVSNGTNHVLATYVLNTCEWANGEHALFATAQCQTGLSGSRTVAAVSIGRAASSFVPVTFANLITRVSFSEPFFMPEDGQTQRVSALFEANVNWTLEIQDSSTNTVRTVTGSGGSMVFNWDGKNDEGTNLPVGNYTYLITAQTNGLAIPSEGDASGGDTNSPPIMSAVTGDFSKSDSLSEGWYPTSAKQAAAAGWNSYYLQTPPMPSVQINKEWFSWEDVFGQQPLTEVPVSEFSKLQTASLEPNIATLNYSGGSSQSTRAPVRPPTTPTRGRAGFFGIAYNTYRGVFSGYSLRGPLNGLPGFPSPPRVQIENNSGNTFLTYPALWQFIPEAGNFIKAMKQGNWAQSFNRSDDALSINDLRASGANIFNNVKLGLLMLHGSFGTSQDFTANGCRQMYFPVTSGSSAEYLRMSEMSLGNSDTNGLKWMAIMACNSLYQANWQNMQNNGIKPYNDNLHLLLGTDSISWTHPELAALWAKYMTKGTNGTPMTIVNAWFEAARTAYSDGFNYGDPIRFAAAGDADCQDDMLQINVPPGGIPFYTSTQVFP